VVPPSRSETMVTTLMVFIFVVIMSVFFYATDGVISWLLQEFLEVIR
jgi:preprotein translocase SecE subunit